jgi:hypothetical protein
MSKKVPTVYEFVLWGLAAILTMPISIVVASRLFNQKNDFLLVIAGLVLIGGVLLVIKLVSIIVGKLQLLAANKE